MDSTEQDTVAPAGANISDETNVRTTSAPDNSAHKPSPVKDGDAGAIISDGTNVRTASAADGSSHKPTSPKDTDTSWDSYKNSDDSFDLDRVFKDVAAECDSADGLRKKLEDSTAPKENPFRASDLNIPITPEEQQAMDDLVNSFNEYGITKEQAEKVFKKLAALVPSDEQQHADADARYHVGLKKLGPDRDTIIAHLTAFSDSMVNDNISMEQ
jgi:hypothetical protein